MKLEAKFLDILANFIFTHQIILDPRVTNNCLIILREIIKRKKYRPGVLSAILYFKFQQLIPAANFQILEELSIEKIQTIAKFIDQLPGSVKYSLQDAISPQQIKPHHHTTKVPPSLKPEIISIENVSTQPLLSEITSQLIPESADPIPEPSLFKEKTEIHASKPKSPTVKKEQIPKPLKQPQKKAESPSPKIKPSPPAPATVHKEIQIPKPKAPTAKKEQIPKSLKQPRKKAESPPQRKPETLSQNYELFTRLTESTHLENSILNSKYYTKFRHDFYFWALSFLEPRTTEIEPTFQEFLRFVEPYIRKIIKKHLTINPRTLAYVLLYHFHREKNKNLEISSFSKEEIAYSTFYAVKHKLEKSAILKP